MKLRRKAWINWKTKSAWLLKSEGDGVDQETKDYLQMRGLDTVRIEEAVPPGGDWVAEEAGEPEHQRPQTATQTMTPKTEDIADNVATRAAELEPSVGAEPAVEAAMEEEGLPKSLRPAVKVLAMKRLVRKADAPVASTKIRRKGDEYVVEAYDSKGNRMPNSDYFTDDKQDAEATAKLMVKPNKTKKQKGRKRLAVGKVARIRKTGQLVVVRGYDEEEKRATVAKVSGDEREIDAKKLKVVAKSGDWGLPTKITNWGDMQAKLTDWYGKLTGIVKSAPELKDADLTGEEQKDIDDAVDEAFMKVADEVGVEEKADHPAGGPRRDFKDGQEVTIAYGPSAGSRATITNIQLGNNPNGDDDKISVVVHGHRGDMHYTLPANQLRKALRKSSNSLVPQDSQNTETPSGEGIAPETGSVGTDMSGADESTMPTKGLVRKTDVYVDQNPRGYWLVDAGTHRSHDGPFHSEREAMDFASRHGYHMMVKSKRLLRACPGKQLKRFVKAIARKAAEKVAPKLRSTVVRRAVRLVMKAQPSDDISPDKACQMLKDGEANGSPLTSAQRGMLGAACARAHKSIKKKLGTHDGCTKCFACAKCCKKLAAKHKAVDDTPGISPEEPLAPAAMSANVRQNADGQWEVWMPSTGEVLAGPFSSPDLAAEAIAERMSKSKTAPAGTMDAGSMDRADDITGSPTGGGTMDVKSKDIDDEEQKRIAKLLARTKGDDDLSDEDVEKLLRKAEEMEEQQKQFKKQFFKKTLIKI